MYIGIFFRILGLLLFRFYALALLCFSVFYVGFLIQGFDVKVSITTVWFWVLGFGIYLYDRVYVSGLLCFSLFYIGFTIWGFGIRVLITRVWQMV